ncbi:tyrosine-protein kinase [Photobacterium sp. NCIMB 13483]|uniref:polysaccharide biosynthesis tyrosine autokinase n=1 Tax=Photobacterium sp. NCIMB 13483 TaxID=2022103 RepID=UPI000D174829|nr:polysaccharide biosynthesis tyrosine autokinase [Photobacterium sp. NCIMB 13483]PST93547.1 tyrosine-protein kinase [Photobacterium sp. NCIMB 13483]
MLDIQNNIMINKDEIDIFEYFKLIKDNYWFIAFFTVVFIIIGVSYAKLATPIYQADVVIKIDKDKNRMTTLGENIADLFSFSYSTQSEIEYLKSRKLLDKTVKKLNLTTIITPKNIPIIGAGLARLSNDPQFVDILKLELLNNNDQEYVLTVIDAKSGQYKLTDMSSHKPLFGSIGKLAIGNGVAILVSSIKAKDGDEFNIKKVDQYTAAVDLQKRLSITEVGKEASGIGGTGIVKITLTGASKDKIQRILNNISSNYLLMNKKRDAMEAERSLEFLKHEIPIVKQKLELSENNLEKYREQHGSIDFDKETKLTLDALADVDSKLNELVYKESALATKYTKKHPIYIALISKRNALIAEKERLSKKIDKLPVTQREILRLTRIVKSNTQIYTQLKQKEQELSVVEKTEIGNATILDSAHSLDNSIKPRKAIAVVMITFVGLILSIAIVLIKYMLVRGVTSIDEVHALGLENYANIPFSKKQYNLNKNGENSLLVIGAHKDLTVESLRTLRANLYFLQKKMATNLVVLCSADVGVGKSFIAANLSVLIAQSNKKVLVIDADMREGMLKDKFGLSQSLGLSDYLKGNISSDDIIQKTEINNLDIICNGNVVNNPSELLMTSRLELLLKEVSVVYDTILIDTPASLAVSDSLIIGSYSPLRLLIGYFSKTSEKEIMTVKNSFSKNNMEMAGFVMNGIDEKASAKCDYSHYIK